VHYDSSSSSSGHSPVLEPVFDVDEWDAALSVPHMHMPWQPWDMPPRDSPAAHPVPLAPVQLPTAVPVRPARKPPTPQRTVDLPALSRGPAALQITVQADECIMAYPVPGAGGPPKGSGARAKASAKSKGQGREPKLCGTCIYCGQTAGGEKSVGDGCDAPATASSLIEGKTRTRRKRKVEGVRKTYKMGKWWRVYGYGGEAYCQRCSEVFRDHIMRQKSNSAKCTREHPCDDCGKILDRFDLPREDVWLRIDAKNARAKPGVPGAPGVAAAREERRVPLAPPLAPPAKRQSLGLVVRGAAAAVLHHPAPRSVERAWHSNADRVDRTAAL
jgi:hypothetical protein